MIKAGIDIGTNTILLLVADVQNGQLKVLEDHVTVVRLGQGVDQNRVFHPDAMTRARDCFNHYAQILKKYPGAEVQAVATSGSRDAKNSEEFYKEVTQTTGIPIKVISGEAEAELSFTGAMPVGQDPEKVAVLDIGGGSTEIVGQEQGKLFRVSFNLGCVRLSERFLKSDPPQKAEVEALQEFVAQEISREKPLLAKIKSRRFLAVAGTPTYLASSLLKLAKFDPDKIHGFALRLDQLKSLRQDFQTKTTAQRLGIGGMDKGRADVIVAGALILETILEAAMVDAVEVSVRGLRYGIVLT